MIFSSGDGWSGKLPNFGFELIDETPIWETLRYAFNFDQYSWTLGFSNLITVVATAMVLGAVSFVVMRLVRSPRLAVGIIAALPFVLVRCEFSVIHGSEISTQAPVPLYWAAPVLACLLSIAFFAYFSRRFTASEP